MYSSKPLISVIIPCYNQCQYLPDALNSVLRQSYPYWECILIDDGSTDETEAIAKKWISGDKRFKYLKKENGGQSTARNAGLKLASGQFIQFLDSDDFIDAKKFELQLRAIFGSPGFVISISDYYYSETNDLTKPHTKWYLPPEFKSENYLHELIMDWQTKLSIPIHCFLFKSNVFKDTRIFFNEGLPNHVDWECWMNIFRLNPEVKYTPFKLAVYRIQSHGISSNKEEMKKGYLQAIEIQKGKFGKNTPEYRLLTKKYHQIKFDIIPGYFIPGNGQIIYNSLRRLKGRLFSSRDRS